MAVSPLYIFWECMEDIRKQGEKGRLRQSEFIQALLDSQDIDATNASRYLREDKNTSLERRLRQKYPSLSSEQVHTLREKLFEFLPDQQWENFCCRYTEKLCGESSLKNDPQIDVLKAHLETAIRQKNWDEFLRNVLETIIGGGIRGGTVLKYYGISSDAVEEYVNYLIEYAASGNQSAMVLFHKCEKEDSENPLFLLAMAEELFYGSLYIRQNVAKSLEYYQKAAKRGHPMAMWSLGQLYERNEFASALPRDSGSNLERVKKALAYYTQAYKYGLPQAQNSLVKLYLRAVLFPYCQANKNENGIALENWDKSFEAGGNNSTQDVYEVVWESQTSFFIKAVGKIAANPIAPTLIEAENAILQEMDFPVYTTAAEVEADEIVYVYQLGTLYGLYRRRREYAITAKEKAQYHELMFAVLKKQADYGEIWAAHEYGRYCERQGDGEKVLKEKRTQWYNQAKIYYQLAAEEYPAKKEWNSDNILCWAKTHYYKFMLAHERNTPEERERFKEQLIKVYKEDEKRFPDRHAELRRAEIAEFLHL